MSARESSDAARVAAVASFTRWPGLFRLGLDLLGGPISALINQQAIYAGNMWACGHNARWSLHIASVLGLIATLAVTVDSWRVWRAIGGGVGDEHGAEATRTRFLAMMGVMVGAISITVVLAQWLAVFMFDSCMRA